MAVRMFRAEALHRAFNLSKLLGCMVKNRICPFIYLKLMRCIGKGIAIQFEQQHKLGPGHDPMMIPFRHGPWPLIDVRDWLRGGSGNCSFFSWVFGSRHWKFENRKRSQRYPKILSGKCLQSYGTGP